MVLLLCIALHPRPLICLIYRGGDVRDVACWFRHWQGCALYRDRNKLLTLRFKGLLDLFARTHGRHSTIASLLVLWMLNNLCAYGIASKLGKLALVI